MAIKGKSREFTGGDFSKKVGLFEGKIIAINPDKEELEKLLGTEIKKDPEYLGEDDEGNDKVVLSIWTEDVKSGMKAACRITLVDKPLSNKNGDKTKFINKQGKVSFWIDSLENTPEWFQAYETHRAVQGEDILYDFLNSWLQIDTKNDKAAELNVELKKLFKGNVKELRAMIGDEELDHTVLFNSVIITKEVENNQGDKETKEYQNLFNRAFLPGNSIKFFNLGGKFPKFVQYYVDQCKYSIKDYFLLEPLQDYDPTRNPVSTDEAKVTAEDDNSY